MSKSLTVTEAKRKFLSETKSGLVLKMIPEFKLGDFRGLSRLLKKLEPRKKRKRTGG